MAKAPDAFRTISEASDALKTPAHVLRFWESKFSQVKPVKRAGGRRYYRPADIDLLSGIRTLLHDQGMTIRGVQKLIAEKGVRHVAQVAPLSHGPVPANVTAAETAQSAAPQPLRTGAASQPDIDAMPAAPLSFDTLEDTGAPKESRHRHYRAGALARALRLGLPQSAPVDKIKPLVARLQALHARLSMGS